ncbi:hypothetical protein DPEC_G00300150 [Dallia pectoralis]|uniref:Uncharacterized protein n=1 Tax=Dallia pectoralis TaxID=75939 RepID=A0ACC2FGH5_DALPE|nr:hypothetical protein DPEC_G00300150 [Dallia pectoralis]
MVKNMEEESGTPHMTEIKTFVVYCEFKVMANRLGLLRGSFLHRCILVLTVLLLVAEITVSRLCSSLIIMVDGFHTLYILIHLALPLPHTTPGRDHSKKQPASPLCHPITSISAQLPVQPSPNIMATSCVSSIFSNSAPVRTTSAQCPSKPLTPPTTQHASLEPSGTNHYTFRPQATLPVTTAPHPLIFTRPASLCGLSYAKARTYPVGALFSALLLAALCVSVSLEIISHFLQPHPIQRPQLATAMAVISLLHNLLLLGFSCGSGVATKTGGGRQGEEGADMSGTGNDNTVKVLTIDGPAVGGQKDTSSVLSACLGGAFQDGGLVLSNPGTSSSLNPDSGPQLQTQAPQVSVGTTFLSQPRCGAHTLPAESQTPPLDYEMLEVPKHFPHPETSGCPPKDTHTESSKYSSCMGLRDNQTDLTTLSTLQPTSPIGASACLPSLIVLTQSLLGSILALTNGLTVLLLDPGCAPISGACGSFIYLDPGFSVVAVAVLLATALPQVRRYGMLLLQASPPQVCVSDLGRRIASVPGVLAVHDLHVWRITESLLVASVHVHCHAGLRAHRCGELMSGVTNVLHSVGVSCCTVQPEFLLASVDTTSHLDNRSRQGPPLAPYLPCSLACRKGCAGKMCCTPPGEEPREPLAPPAGGSEEEPHVLIIENTFL